MADARLRVFQATVGTAALHQRSETSGCIIYSVAVDGVVHKYQDSAHFLLVGRRSERLCRRLVFYHFWIWSLSFFHFSLLGWISKVANTSKIENHFQYRKYDLWVCFRIETSIVID